MNKVEKLQSIKFEYGTSNGYTSQAALWIWKIVPVTLLTIGTVGNILNIIVLSRRQMRKYSTTIYLLFLAVSDMFMLWGSISRQILITVWHVEVIEISVLFENEPIRQSQTLRTR